VKINKFLLLSFPLYAGDSLAHIDFYNLKGKRFFQEKIGLTDYVRIAPL
jgi:hypothetical protein